MILYLNKPLEDFMLDVIIFLIAISVTGMLLAMVIDEVTENKNRRR